MTSLPLLTWADFAFDDPASVFSRASHPTLLTILRGDHICLLIHTPMSVWLSYSPPLPSCTHRPPCTDVQLAARFSVRRYVGKHVHEDTEWDEYEASGWDQHTLSALIKQGHSFKYIDMRGRLGSSGAMAMAGTTDTRERVCCRRLRPTLASVQRRHHEAGDG